MSPPKAAPNNLPSTFHHAGWTIKYNLISPPTLQPTGGPSPKSLKTLVFIHGTPWSSLVFQPLVQSLLSSPSSPFLKTHRILLYDMPGFGKSQVPYPNPSSHHQNFKDDQNDTSVATQARALQALLSHLKIDKPAVLAHDIGGAIALRAHLILGVEMERMMLLDSNAVLPWGDGFYALAREEPAVFARLPAHVFEAVVRAVVRSASVTTHGLEGGWEEALMGPWIGSAEAQGSFVKQIAQAEDGDVAEMFAEGGEGCLYRKVRCGVSILWGQGDCWIPREKMERLCGLLGERLERFVVVEEAGHLVMLDQPGRVEEEVRRWLEAE